MNEALDLIERLIDSKPTLGLLQEANEFLRKQRSHITTGSWFADGYYIKTDYPAGKIVGVVHEAEGCNNAIADAHLMAAAPNLLQACLLARQEIKLNLGSQHVIATLEEAMEKANA